MPLLCEGTISELAISDLLLLGETPVVATGSTLGDLVVVDILFQNPANDLLRLCNIGIFGYSTPHEGVEKTLIVPFEISTGVDIEQYGQPARSTPNVGRLQFALTDTNQRYVHLGVLGGPITIYTGTYAFNHNSADELISWDDPFADDTLTTVFRGVVTGISCDVIRGIVTIDFSDFRFRLNEPYHTSLYDSTPPTPEGVKGRNRPFLRGHGISLEPVLYDPVNLIYNVSAGILDDVLQVRVGGITWNHVVSSPSPGEWSFSGGSVILGGDPGGGEIRVNAKSENCLNYIFGNLMAYVALPFTFDSSELTALNSEFPYQLGHYMVDPVNILDVLDDIAYGVGGWWAMSPNGNMVAGLIKAPTGTPVTTYAEVDLFQLELLRRISPVRSLQVEYQRNWQPGTVFYDGVDLAKKEEYKRPGILTDAVDSPAAPFEFDTIDIQAMRSVITSSPGAIAMRDRLWEAWGVAREVWQIKITGDVPSLMEVVELDHPIFDAPKLFRVTGVTRSYGGGLNTLTLWG